MTVEGFKGLTKILPEPSLLVSAEGQVLAGNPAVLRILEIDRSTLKSRNLFELSTTDEEKLREYLRNCSRSRQLLIGAIELAVSGKEPLAFRCEGALLEPATDTSEAMIFLRLKAKESASSTFRVLTQKITELNREITERKRAEQERERLYREAQEASRLKDEFLATVSHELRTPLTSILGWARMLKKSEIDEAMLRRALETIERNALSQAQLIEDLLDVSRIISGKLRLDIRPIDLTKVVSSAVESLRLTAENKSVRLELIIDPKADYISGDSGRIQQALWNLISNAIKFTPKNGRVQVRLERVGSHIEIVVSDSGEGIPQEFLPFVFERFRQFDSSKTRQYGGLGLGLAIVRHLVELHGGSAHAFSDGVGKGATFVVRLPMRVVRELPQPPEQNVPRFHPTADDETGAFDLKQNLRDLHILVADDETDARDLLKTILEQHEATVTLAASAAEAFYLINQVRPDVIVSDIEMPNENGYSLIQRIRELSDERLKKIPAIALTAHARREDRLHSLSAGFDSHIAKPFEPAELVMVIEGLARRMRDYTSSV